MSHVNSGCVFLKPKEICERLKGLFFKKKISSQSDSLDIQKTLLCGKWRSPELEIRGILNKFPDFFRMGTFSDSTHMKL